MSNKFAHFARDYDEAHYAQAPAWEPAAEQRFKAGDRVRISEYFTPDMDHFDGRGCLATVVASYGDQFGVFPDPNDPEDPDREPTYTLDIDGFGRRSWYEERFLTKA